MRIPMPIWTAAMPDTRKSRLPNSRLISGASRESSSRLHTSWEANFKIKKNATDQANLWFEKLWPMARAA